MAVYEITAPDGQTYEINAPDGADESEIMAYAKKNMGGGLAVPPIPTATQQDDGDPMSWGDAMLSAVGNIPASAGQFASDIVQPVLHPIDTVKTITGLGRGILEKLIPGDQGWTADEKTADLVGKFFMDRYGSIDGIKRTLAKDPVGMLSDVTAVLSGGGTLAARAPGIIGKAGRVAQTAGRVADPLSMAGNTARLAGKHIIEPVVSNVVGLATGAGSNSLRSAAKAGAAGGRTAESFLDNMRGNVSPEAVVGEAKAALANMRQERGAAYRGGMAGVKADNTVLDFGPIDDALSGVSDIGSFKGQNISKSTDAVRKQIAETIDNWRGLDPAAFHTAEGLDALKKAIGDIKDSADFGSPSRIIADQVYNAIRGQIVKQAPDYAKVMKDYETASDLLSEVQRSLSLNNKASADTALRKLQSVMRNNANTNYGNRVNQAKALEAAGAPDLMAKLSGQALSSPTPRGIQGALAIPTAIGTGVTNPWLLPGMAMSSPRLMGEAAYYTGKAGGKTSDLAAKLGAPAARQMGQQSYQLGRVQNDEEQRRILIDALMRPRLPN